MDSDGGAGPAVRDSNLVKALTQTSDGKSEKRDPLL